ncbi:DNA replication/repair protein RecF [Alphaproteobacteria bacterium]|nr:DNA replication/repair protein RecF [Alphaproteobacteria bacterium]
MALTSNAYCVSLSNSKMKDKGISHWLRKIRLLNFRNYREVHFEIQNEPVVLIGKNGTGKTNLMEAISLLAPGRGLRRANTDDFSYKDLNKPMQNQRKWAVYADLITNDMCWQIGTGISEESNRRIVKINQETETQEMLAKICSISWLTPQMDGLFLDSPKTRRLFIDRLAISFDPAHSGRLLRFLKSYRERNRMLANEVKDPIWYSLNETQLAETGVAIMATRNALIEDINRTVQNMQTEFPKFSAQLVGGGTELFNRIPASEIEDIIKQNAKKNREANNSSIMGPHATDLLVTHSEKKQFANEASTGEQKALLITFILAHAHLQSTRLEKPPLLLLDDVAALLDPWRRDALFDACRIFSGQVWYSGSDEKSFDSLKSKAQYFYVNDGIINY